MGEVCRQKLAGCLSGTVAGTEPDALPAEETGARPGGRCTPSFSKQNEQARLGVLTRLHRVDPWSRIGASLLGIRSACVVRHARAQVWGSGL